MCGLWVFRWEVVVCTKHDIIERTFCFSLQHCWAKTSGVVRQMCVMYGLLVIPRSNCSVRLPKASNSLRHSHFSKLGLGAGEINIGRNSERRRIPCIRRVKLTYDGMLYDHVWESGPRDSDEMVTVPGDWWANDRARRLVGWWPGIGMTCWWPGPETDQVVAEPRDWWNIGRVQELTNWWLGARADEMVAGPRDW